MSDELISRKVIDDATTEFCNQCSCPDMQMFGLFREIISEVPAVDAAPVVHGEWIDDNLYTIPKCSICGKRIHSGEWNEENNYCGHCGAKMDGGKA